MRYICAGVAEQQEGLFVLNLTANNISQDGIHHVSASLVRGALSGIASKFKEQLAVPFQLYRVLWELIYILSGNACLSSREHSSSEVRQSFPCVLSVAMHTDITRSQPLSQSLWRQRSLHAETGAARQPIRGENQPQQLQDDL